MWVEGAGADNCWMGRGWDDWESSSITLRKLGGFNVVGDKWRWLGSGWSLMQLGASQASAHVSSCAACRVRFSVIASWNYRHESCSAAY